MEKELLKSPMNYIGNKYRILEQILPKFPQSHTMVDLFAGGLDVAINSNAEVIYCNDINTYLIDIYKTFQKKKYSEVIDYIEQKIREFSLSKTNDVGYMEYRNFYNTSDKNPLDLYLLLNYSFNYQLRFNSKHEYNNPFGKNRSSFNDSLRIRLEKFMERTENFIFTSVDFRDFDYSVLKKGDFIYCDPPYSISTGSYNDGKRGFNGWTQKDDFDLMKLLDSLSEKGIKFAMSNVVEHKGLRNDELIKWAKKYNTIEISCKYNNCNYQTKNKEYITREVLIINE